jgi:hypothetical protein
MTTSEALQWPEAAGRLAAARNWWVATAGRGGPHAVPVWGVIVDGTPWFYSDPGSVRAGDLAEDPRIVVHLESGDDVLIVRGLARNAGDPTDHPAVVAAYAAKYRAEGDAEFLPGTPEMAGIVLFAVQPAVALAWTLADYFGSQRRWAASPG